MPGKSFELDVIQGHWFHAYVEKPPDDNPKDYVVNIYFKNYEAEIRNQEVEDETEDGINVVRVDYKEVHNGVHIDRYYTDPPRKDENIDWDFDKARNKLFDNWREWGHKYLNNHGSKQVKIE